MDPSLNLLILLQIVSGMVLSLVAAAFGGVQLGASFAVGSALMVVSSGAIGWSTWRTIQKKSIAWTVMIIVIKYAVLLGSVIVLARTNWFSSVGAVFGIASFLVAAMALAVLQQKKEII